MTANSQAVPVDGIPNQSYDSNSNRISTQGYIYDLAGNLVRGQKPDGSWQKFEYDQAGRLTIVRNDATNAVEYGNGYTSSRQRISSFSDSTPGVITYYAWGGSSVIAEFTTNLSNNQTTSVWKKNYIYAGSRLLETQTNNNSGGETQEFHHPDRLGTKLVTNSQIISQFEQSTLPFGTALDAETTGTTNQRFTSYDRSTVANLDYAVNRSYSSGTGRFTSVDPIGMASTSIGDPQSMNLYAYVENNPIDFVDPSGLDIVGTVDVIDVDTRRVEADLMGFILRSISMRRQMELPQAPFDSGGGGGIYEVVNVTAGPDLVESSQSQVGQQLSPCLKNLFKKYFQDIDVHGEKMNPVDALFISGVPGWLIVAAINVPGAVIPQAIVLGNKNVYYSSSAFNINGGNNWNQLQTLYEEIYHVQQFLQDWAGASLPDNGTPSYSAAQNIWKTNYLLSSAWAKLKGKDSYDNGYEEEAKKEASNFRYFKNNSFAAAPCQ